MHKIIIDVSSRTEGFYHKSFWICSKNKAKDKDEDEACPNLNVHRIPVLSEVQKIRLMTNFILIVEKEHVL